MKKTLLLFLTIGLLGFEISAQSLVENDIVGTWKVLSLSTELEVPKEQMDMMEILKDSFLKSKFQFDANQNFSFDFSIEEMAITNAHWKYNEVTDSYLIQEWKNKDSDTHLLMEIKTKVESGKITFLLPETFFSLEMVKE